MDAYSIAVKNEQIPTILLKNILNGKSLIFVAQQFINQKNRHLFFAYIYI